MKSRQPSERLLRELCAAVDPSDGINPRKRSQEDSRKENNHRDRSLCHQVKRVIQLSLAQSRQEPLRYLYVQAAEPAPDATRLCVLLEPFELALSVPATTLLANVHADAGRIRCDVASMIHRKRVPTLTYRIVPPATCKEVADG